MKKKDEFQPVGGAEDAPVRACDVRRSTEAPPAGRAGERGRFSNPRLTPLEAELVQGMKSLLSMAIGHAVDAGHRRDGVDRSRWVMEAQALISKAELHEDKDMEAHEGIEVESAATSGHYPVMRGVATEFRLRSVLSRVLDHQDAILSIRDELFEARHPVSDRLAAMIGAARFGDKFDVEDAIQKALGKRG